MKEPKFVSLNELITKRIFKIPDFQRAYSWTSVQRTQLFNDILVALSKQTQHFMSTIVVSFNAETPTTKIGIDDYEFMTVVDGQQRITTLIIYLKVLSNIMSEIEELKQYGEKLQTRLDLENKSNFILLQTNHNTNDIFKNLLQLNSKEDVKKLNKAKTSADLNLINAYLESYKAIENILEYVPEFSINKVDSIISLYNTCLEKLKFILYFVDSEEDNYKLFEVLNDRGLKVSDLDKAKSILMGIVYNKSNDIETKTRQEKINNIYNKWIEIYKFIGVNEISAPFSENEILQFTSLLFAKQANPDTNKKYINKIPTTTEAIEIINEYCVDYKSVLVFTDLLMKITEIMRETSKKLKDVNFSYVLYPCLQVQHSRFLYLVLELRKNELGINYFNHLISHWENIVIINYYIDNKSKKTYLSPYINFAFNIYENNNIFKSFELFTDKVLDITKSSIKQSKHFFLTKEITPKDFQWKWINYLLLNYEANLKNTNIVNIINKLHSVDFKSTVEHIYPQTTEEKKDPPFIHYIGNFTLVPNKINSQLGNKPFYKKNEIYKTLKEDFPSLKMVIKNNEWNESTIENRTIEINKFIEENWLLPYSKNKIDLITK